MSPWKSTNGRGYVTDVERRVIKKSSVAHTIEAAAKKEANHQYPHVFTLWPRLSFLTMKTLTFHYLVIL